MRQIQTQSQVQKLALTQTMRNSLALLSMGQEDVVEAIRREQSRNAFLRAIPPARSGGSGEFEQPDVQYQDTEIDEILRQVGLVRLSTRQSGLAVGLVHSLDERGFLADSPAEIASYLECSEAELHELVCILQEAVEPSGIFAWSLADSFRLQLQAKNRFDPLMEQLLARLDLIAKQDVAAICEECGVDEEDAIDMLDDIRALNPAPLARETDLPEIQKGPELIIKAGPDGGYLAELNEAAMPRILTDDALFSATMATDTDANAQYYYRDCYRGAANMVRAMQKRANTLLATGQAIADRQQKFIRTGRQRDKLPLTMEQLSASVAVHKSTISRALSNCSIATDLGTFPAHHFLARALNAEESERTREQAMQRLVLLIKTENSLSPYSDENLVSQMTKANFSISRRTVAKYRGILGIPCARDRKSGRKPHHFLD